MKRYSVVYLADAEGGLASSWENAANRALVTKAADMADTILATSPQMRSIYLGEDLWRLEVTPLRFYFTIREEDRLVEISDVILCE